jgi:hypothetical protein
MEVGEVLGMVQEQLEFMGVMKDGADDAKVRKFVLLLSLLRSK